MAESTKPTQLPDQASQTSLGSPQTLSSEAVLDALKLILTGTSLTEVLTSITRLIEESGVVCGDIGGKSDWNMVVTSDSRCLGTLVSESESEGGDVKLFITS